MFSVVLKVVLLIGNVAGCYKLNSGTNWTFSGSVWTHFSGKYLSKVMAATWQEQLLKGGYSGRYQICNEGPEDGDEDWILKDNKWGSAQ